MAEKLVLRRLNENDEAAFFEGLADWPTAERFWYSFDWKDGMSYQDLLEKHKDNEAGLNLQEGFVPMTMLYGFVGGRIVGRVSIRHTLNDFLRARGGHVGYSIAKAFRDRGYATEMLKQALPECRRLGINAMLLTCGDANTASWKVIEKTGAVLTDTVYDEHYKELVRRYWLLFKPAAAAVFKPQPILETQRLLLRPFTLKDAKRIQSIANDERISATTTLPYPYPPGLAEEWIAKQESEFASGKGVAFAIVPKETGEIVGVASLFCPFGTIPALKKAEVGYWIAVDHWKNGYATEAVKALMPYAFTELDVRKIYGRRVGMNEASGLVMEKAGMKKEGVLRQEIDRGGIVHDMVFYGILKSEFKAD